MTTLFCFFFSSLQMMVNYMKSKIVFTIFANSIQIVETDWNYVDVLHMDLLNNKHLTLLCTILRYSAPAGGD